MGVRLLTRDEVVEVTLDALRLDGTGLPLHGDEVLAALIRRLASFHCPCSRRTLKMVTMRCLSHALELAEPAERIEQVVESLISYGDLVEVAVLEAKSETGRSPLLYLSPPQIVPLKDESVLLLGIEPDDQASLPYEIEQKILLSGHIRRLPNATGLVGELVILGYAVVRESTWLKSPAVVSAQELVAQYDRTLALAPRAAGLGELKVLRPSSSIWSYRERWGPSAGFEGKAIARREQRFGADLWVYAEFSGGTPVRLLDLGRSNLYGRDEAWRLQAAMDAVRGQPQVFRVQPLKSPEMALHLYQPIPTWVERWLDIVGRRAPRDSGSLMSFTLPGTAIRHAEEFLEEHLWIRRVDTGEQG